MNGSSKGGWLLPTIGAATTLAIGGIIGATIAYRRSSQQRRGQTPTNSESVQCCNVCHVNSYIIYRYILYAMIWDHQWMTTIVSFLLMTFPPLKVSSSRDNWLTAHCSLIQSLQLSLNPTHYMSVCAVSWDNRIYVVVMTLK
jgi:hypothetical protein